MDIFRVWFIVHVKRKVRVDTHMSIPTRIDILGPGMKIMRNVNIGTISYGRDLTQRDTWLSWLHGNFKLIKEDSTIIERYCPWFKDFDEIYIPRYDFTFTRNELMHAWKN